MKLSINNQNNESANQVNNAIAPIKVAPGSVPMSPEAFRAEYPSVVDAVAEEITADAEVKREEAKSEKSATPKKKAASKRDQAVPKRKVTIKRKKAEPKAENPEPLTTNPEPTAGLPAARFSIVPYTNKQGETGYFLFGFTSQEEAKGLADRMAKSVREGFRYENHVRYGVVGFPPRYAQMAQQMCDALNAGDAAAVAKIAASTFDVYAAAVADGKAENDRKRAERKEAEAKAKAKEVAKVKKSAGLYSKEDVAAMLADVLAGKDVPEEIKALLAKAA